MLGRVLLYAARASSHADSHSRMRSTLNTEGIAGQMADGSVPVADGWEDLPSRTAATHMPLCQKGKRVRLDLHLTMLCMYSRNAVMLVDFGNLFRDPFRSTGSYRCPSGNSQLLLDPAYVCLKAIPLTSHPEMYH